MLILNSAETFLSQNAHYSRYYCTDQWLKTRKFMTSHLQFVESTFVDWLVIEDYTCFHILSLLWYEKSSHSYNNKTIISLYTERSTRSHTDEILGSLINTQRIAVCMMQRVKIHPTNAATLRRRRRHRAGISTIIWPLTKNY